MTRFTATFHSVWLMALFFPSILMGQTTPTIMHLGSTSERPDLAIYAVDRTMHPLATLDNPSTSPYQLYVGLWRNGRVILASNTAGSRPYYSLTIAPSRATHLIDDVVSNALTIKAGSFPPGTSLARVQWVIGSSDRLAGPDASLHEIRQLDAAPQSKVSAEAARVHKLIRDLFASLPPPSSGTVLNVTWEY